MESTPETRRHAQEILDFLTENELGVTHDQDSWTSASPWEPEVCGTTMCIAGASCFLTSKEQFKTALKKQPAFPMFARMNLGLNNREADLLFYTMNEKVALEMLRAVANGDEDKFYEIYEDLAKEVDRETHLNF